MFTEKELIETMRQCEQEPITVAKRSTLADLYIIYDHLFGEPPEDSKYSFKNKTENIIETNGGSKFLEAINGKDSEKIWNLLDEFMEAIKTLHPKMYERMIEKIMDI